MMTVNYVISSEILLSCFFLKKNLLPLKPIDEYFVIVCTRTSTIILYIRPCFIYTYGFFYVANISAILFHSPYNVRTVKPSLTFPKFLSPLFFNARGLLTSRFILGNFLCSTSKKSSKNSSFSGKITHFRKKIFAWHLHAIWPKSPFLESCMSRLISE